MILMIDDSARGVMIYKEELEASGYQVLHHRSVDEALRDLEARRQDFELVILDVMMPPGESFRQDQAADLGLRTGVRVYERLRERAPHLPVVVLTNVTNPGVQERFRRERGCWFLQKADYLPFQLAEKVREVLSGPTREGRGEP
jgi:CheY-like chemotaxis protein